MFLPNPGVLAAGAGGKTYDEFVAHIAGIAGTAQAGWNNAATLSGTALVSAQPTALESYEMTGSPWLALYHPSSIWCRVIQHALPNESVFNEQRSASRTMLVRTVGVASAAKAALNRNGYLSNAGVSAQSRRLDELLAWIDGQPMQMQPHLGLGPEPYDW